MSAPHRARALTIIAEHIGVSLDALTPQARLDENLGCDSLDVLELLMALEDVFDVAFSSEEDAAVTTVGDLLDLVERNAEAAP